VAEEAEEVIDDAAGSTTVLPLMSRPQFGQLAD
jgi:hypothetical protein